MPKTLIEFKTPKEKVRKARMTIAKAKAKERKAKENRKEKRVITRAEVKAVGETIFDPLQVIQPIHVQEFQWLFV